MRPGAPTSEGSSDCLRRDPTPRISPSQLQPSGRSPPHPAELQASRLSGLVWSQGKSKCQRREEAQAEGIISRGREPGKTLWRRCICPGVIEWEGF